MHLLHKKKHLYPLLILTISTMMVNLPATAQQPDRNKEPSDFIVAEMVAGTVGAIVGITLGYTIVPTLQATLNIPNCRSIFEGASDPRCNIPYRIGLTLGGLLGSSLLVSRTGSRFGVRGNLGLTILGAGLGSYVGLEIAAWVGMLGYHAVLADLIPTIAWPAIVIIVVGISGFMPGSLTTLGFNLGATMEVKMLSVFSDRLELVGAQLRW